MVSRRSRVGSGEGGLLRRPARTQPSRAVRPCLTASRRWRAPRRGSGVGWRLGPAVGGIGLRLGPRRGRAGHRTLVAAAVAVCRSPLLPTSTATATATAAVPTATATAVVTRAPVGLLLGLDRHVGDLVPAAVADLALGGERLEQTGADLLPGHLHQAEAGHLGDLVAGPVPAQALDQPAQQQLAVAGQHHVDEVDHDDAADVAQPELADDLLGRLQVVAGHGGLEVAAAAGELAGVHVDHGHRLGAVDDQRSARGQEHLALERLGDLLVQPVLGEEVTVGLARPSDSSDRAGAGRRARRRRRRPRTRPCPSRCPG